MVKGQVVVVNMLRIVWWMLWIYCAFAWTNQPLDDVLQHARRRTTTARHALRVVVIGGGWAGFSVADALSTAVTRTTTSPSSSSSSSFNNKNTAKIHIDLLDASPRGPGGLAGAGWKTSPTLGLNAEVGIHGFWREYRNTFATMTRIGLHLDQVLTEYTPSVLVSSSGQVALAPVLGQANDDDRGDDHHSMVDARQQQRRTRNIHNNNPTKVLEIVASLLPPPLDLALLTQFSPSSTSPLTIVDRVSALALLGVWADFQPDNYDSWQRYDKMSAESLFCAKAGITRTLYQELVSPLLHVLPMTPGYDCSAAAALSCFHVFALQSRGAFDVRWCRGSIQERIFQPWVQQLQQRGNVHIRTSAKVTAIQETTTTGDDDDKARFIVTVHQNETIACDAIVFAIGATTMKRLLPNLAPLTQIPITKTWDRLRGVTCVAVRLFFRASTNSTNTRMLPAAMAHAMNDSPVWVCGPHVGGIPQLIETGFCIYDLQRLQDGFPCQVMIGDEKEEQVVVALEVDFFRADALANMANDMEVAMLTLQAVAAALDIDPIEPTLLLDVAVVRAREAVSHFDVSSASCSPSVKLGKGLYICGDWIDRTGHASWSTEKSVVTGRQAAAALARDFSVSCQADVIPTAKDSPQLAALRQLMGVLRWTSPSNFVNQLPF